MKKANTKTGMYAGGRNAFLEGSVSWTNDIINAALVDLSLYTPNLAKDISLLDVPKQAILDVVELKNKTAIAGVADADDITFRPRLSAGRSVIIIYHEPDWALTHIETNYAKRSLSRLIVYVGSSIVRATKDNPIDVIWDNGSNKIFKL